MFDRCHTSATPRIRRAYMRVYVDRLRRALEKAFDEARLVVDPGEVLVAEETATNEVTYRLHGTVDWLPVTR
jgi:hypothetical protein